MPHAMATLFQVLLLAATVPNALANLNFIQLPVHTNAVCLDGTPAGYYWKPATPALAPPLSTSSTSNHPPSPSNVWIIHLQGGGWCYDAASCKHRCGTPASPNTANPLCSSTTFPPSKALGGIFWAHNPTLRSSNKVFVPYCTSDGHMGDSTFEGWQFRGQRVIQSVLTELVDTHGLGSGLAGTDTLIFGGASAGGKSCSGVSIHSIRSLHAFLFLSLQLFFLLLRMNGAFGLYRSIH